MNELIILGFIIKSSSLQSCNIDRAAKLSGLLNLHHCLIFISIRQAISSSPPAVAGPCVNVKERLKRDPN